MDDNPPRKSSTTLSNHPHLKLLRLSHAAIHQARAARDHHAPTIYYVNPPAPPPLPASSMADPSAQLQGAEARGSPRRVLFSLSSLVFLPPLSLNAREASGTSPREAGWPDSQSVISLSGHRNTRKSSSDKRLGAAFAPALHIPVFTWSSANA